MSIFNTVSKSKSNVTESRSITASTIENLDKVDDTKEETKSDIDATLLVNGNHEPAKVEDFPIKPK